MLMAAPSLGRDRGPSDERSLIAPPVRNLVHLDDAYDHLGQWENRGQRRRPSGYQCPPRTSRSLAETGRLPAP